MTSVLLSTLLIGAPAVSIEQVKTLQATRVINVCGAPFGPRFAASLEDNSVQLFDARTGASVRKFVGHPQPVYGIAFNSNGTVMATGDETARIFLWDVKTGKKLREFTRDKAHTRGIQSIQFSSDGKRIVTSGRDDMIIVWNTHTGKPVSRIAGDGANVSAATFKYGSPVIYAATLGEGVKMWFQSTGVKVALGGHADRGADDLAMNIAGTKAISAGMDNVVAAWDMNKRKRVASLKGHEDTVIRVALSPNGRLGASSSSDRTVRVWDLTGYKPIGVIRETSAVGSPVCFTGDNAYLITANMNDQIVINKVLTAPVKPARKKR